MATTHAPPQPARSRARRLPVPVTEPPFDDELGLLPPDGDRAGPGGWRGRQIPGQGVLALEPDPAPDQVPVPVTLDGQVVANSLWLRSPGPQAELTGPQPGPTGPPGPPLPPVPPGQDGLPDPRRWIARLAQSALECLHGRRSVQQLVRWTDEPVYRALARQAAAQEAPAPADRPRIRALRVCRVSGSVAEASVVVQWGTVTRAVAVRLEAADGRWLCTAFDVVEPNPPRKARRPRRTSGQRAAQASSKATA